MRPFLPRRVLGAAVASAAALCAAVPAEAAAPFPITESFTNSSLQPGWQLGDAPSVAALTAAQDGEGAGWLRLTPAVQDAYGYIFNDVAFPSTNGVLAEFDYAVHGGTGADGLVFFLYDGATTANDFAPGPLGGSLGYSHCPETSTPGLNNAYVGVGLDTWGNFSLGSFCNQGGLAGSSLYPNRVTVRAGETAPSPYSVLASQTTSQALSATRAQARHVTVAINDGRLQTYIEYPNGEIQTVAKDVVLPANVPSTLKLGFIAGTGGSTNNHEIRNTKVVEPVDLRTTVTDGKAGDVRSTSHTWTAVVENNSPNLTTDATVKATTTALLSDASWTCVTSGGGTCAAASGVGLPDTTATLPGTATATYTITASSGANTDVANMTVDAQPTGDTGELGPLDNAATDVTYLPPVNDVPPTSTWNGTTATRTANGTWRGGSITYVTGWQTCEADGTACVDAASNTTSWNPTSAVTGGTIRTKVTATNVAGSTSAYGAPVTLPTTTITSGPSGTVNANAASIGFGHTGTSAQCRLDGGAWSTCTSPWAGNVTHGTHTLEVRGHHGVLADGSPASRTWTVDDHTGVTLTAPAAGLTADATPDIAFTGDEPGTYEVRIDGTPVATGTLDGDRKGTHTPTAALSDGSHAIAVTITDTAGNDATADVTIQVDTTAPAVPTLTGDPPTRPTAKNAHTFTWDQVPGTTARCRLDGGAWSACASPYAVTGLPDGPHTFDVEVLDPAGNPSGPTSTTWTVDTTPPTRPTLDTPSTDGTPGAVPTIRSSERVVRWGAEAGSTSRCRVDGGAWATCTSPLTLKGLAEGQHALEVEVVDAAGNVSDVLRTTWIVAPALVERPAEAPAATPAPLAACTSRRAFDVRWSVPKGSRPRSFRVRVDGKRVGTLKRTSRRWRVDLRGRKKSEVRVTIEAVGAKTRAVRTLRVYRTCEAKVAKRLPTIALKRVR